MRASWPQEFEYCFFLFPSAFPRTMSHSSSSSDDEAPESVTFADSRRSAKAGQEALQNFHSTEKQKLKERRRTRDQVLKERKAQAQSKGRTQRKATARSDLSKDLDAVGRSSGDEDGREPEARGEPSTRDLEARMIRAMQQAAQEDDESGTDGSEEEDSEREGLQDGSGSDSELESQADGDADEAEQESDEGEDTSDEDGDEHSPGPPAKKARQSQNKDYLPDHLFASALSEAASLASATAKGKAKATEQNVELKSKKRKRAVSDVLEETTFDLDAYETVEEYGYTAEPQTYCKRSPP